MVHNGKNDEMDGSSTLKADIPRERSNRKVMSFVDALRRSQESEVGLGVARVTCSYFVVSRSCRPYVPRQPIVNL